MMRASKEFLLDYLHQLGISTTGLYEHEPLFSTQEADRVYDALGVPGARCKNLFLKDSKNGFWLVVALASTNIDLKKLGKDIGAPELRFASPQLLMHYLGVEPGSVTPFGLMNNRGHEVQVILDEHLSAQELLAFHPLENTATLTICPEDLYTFIESRGYAIQHYTFDSDAPNKE